MRNFKINIFLKLGIFLVLILVSLIPFFFFPPTSTILETKKKPTYAGSTSCLECHKQEFNDWKSSHHGLAERYLSSQFDHPAFFPPKKLKKGKEVTRFQFSSNKFQVIGSDNKVIFPERVIGEDPLRQFLVKFPSGRYQVMEASYDPHRNEWFNVFGKENRRPGEWGHWTGRGMNWNSNCASCHNTNVQKNYDEKTDSYNTTMSEMAVSCESCHGPLKDHAQGSNPPKFTKDQIIETCASCHSRREDLTGKFRPGNSFHDHFILSIVDNSDVFYPDGQVKGENYEYSSFLGSKMYEKGVRCIDCHNPHTAKLRLPGNLMCLKCHDGSEPNAPIIDPSQHSFHKIDPLYSNNNLKDLEEREKRKVAKMGGECVNCHMPQTQYMERHWRHDHGFTIPDPKLTKEQQIPNACNRCHQDKKVEWAIQWTEKWYGKKMERLTRDRTKTIVAAKSGNQSSILKLIEMSRESFSSYWKAAAINILAPFSYDQVVDNFLMDSLNDPDPLVREKASEFFEGDILKYSLRDPVRSVRYNAQWALRSSIDHQTTEGKELEEILNFHADQPVGRLQKGAFFLSRGNLDEALINYEIASKWDPLSASIHHDMAIILSGQNRAEEAAAHLIKACELEPKDAELRYKLGLALNELGKKREAKEAFKKALLLNPNDSRIQKALKSLE